MLDRVPCLSPFLLLPNMAGDQMAFQSMRLGRDKDKKWKQRRGYVIQLACATFAVAKSWASLRVCSEGIFPDSTLFLSVFTAWLSMRGMLQETNPADARVFFQPLLWHLLASSESYVIRLSTWSDTGNACTSRQASASGPSTWHRDISLFCRSRLVAFCGASCIRS